LTTDDQPAGVDDHTERRPHRSRLGWLLVAGLICIGAAAWVVRPGAPPPPPLTIAYTRGLAGDGGALERVAASLKPWRDQPLLLVDLGNSLTGRGEMDAGLAMAAGMEVCGYAAVLPSERDLWQPLSRLEEFARLGHFPFLLTNARAGAVPDAWRRPLVRDVGGIRVAVFGVFAPPHDFSIGVDGGLALSRNLEKARAALQETSADVRVVLARVRDAGTLARMLPEADVILPAGASTLQPARLDAPPDAPLPPRSVAMRRVAPALESGERMGFVQLTREADGTISTRFDTQPLAAAEPDEALAAASARYRDESKYSALDAARMHAFVPGDAVEAAPAVAEMVCVDLECDAAVLASNEVSGKLKGMVGADDVARCVARDARVRVVAVTGPELLRWLEGGAGAVAGVRVFRDGQGKVWSASLGGRPLEKVERLKAAVSTRLLDDRAGLPLSDLVSTALLTRPLLHVPPLACVRVPSSREYVSEMMAKARTAVREGHPAQARVYWAQALAFDGGLVDTEGLLKAMQEASPGQTPSYLALGALHEAAGNWRAAWDAYEMGATAYPEEAAWPLAQATLLLRCQRPLAALTLLSQARGKGADTALLEGMARLMAGDPENASAVLSGGLGNRAEPALRALAGLALLRSGSVSKARSVWSTLDSTALTAAEPSR